MERYYRTRMAASEEAVEVDLRPAIHIEAPWHVLLFNDEVHAFDEVVLQVMKATGCDLQHAAEITLEAHTSGKAGAYSGAFEDCLRVEGILAEIRLRTQISG